MSGPHDEPPPAVDAGRDALTELDNEVELGGRGVGLGAAYLVVRYAERVDIVPLLAGREVLVGRAATATISVDNPRVSREHARIRLDGDRIHVEDLGSRNGTRVNTEILRSESRRSIGPLVIAVGPIEIIAARSDRSLDYEAPLGEDDEAAPISTSDTVVVADPAMTKLYQVLRRVAATPATVLVVGETGSGKEIAAERVHSMSPRASGPFVRLNCASMPEALLESELFGHERGAFTGADRRRIGFFEAAQGGTLFLDEIGEMPASLQAKVLRALEQRTIVRVGGTHEIPVDVRFVCATNRDLPAEIAAGRFRQDLYYRISTFTLEVPPLRERRAEIVLLADLFVRRFAHETGVAPPRIEADALAALQAHDWPGNVRELRNAMEYAMVMSAGGPVEAAHLPRAVRGTRGVDTAPPPPGPSAPPPTSIRAAVEDVERSAIIAAIEAENNNHTRAAKRLGMSRRALLYKLAKYKLRG